MQKSISLLILSLLLSLTTIAQESIHDLFKLLDDSDVELLQNKVDAAHAQIDKDFHLVLYSMSNPQVVQSTESIASSSTNSIYLVINFAELYENEAYVFISPDLSDTYSEEFLAEVADEVMMSELDFISLEGDIKLTFIAGIDAFLNAKTPVTFTVHDEQNYGFDLYDNTPALEDDYPLLEALEDTPYRIAWKSLPTLGFDKAITEMKDGSLIPDNIQWKDENGIVIATTDVLDSDGTQKQLFLSGSAGNTDTKEIHAIQSIENDYGQSEEQIIGQLNLISYDEKDLNIVLVPVNTATVSNALSLANDLQDIFDPAIINVHLTLHDGISVSDFDDIMDDEDSGFLADYTDEMQDIISTFKRNNNITNKTYYLFVVQDAEDPNLEGFMPRNRKYGFLFENNIGGDEAFVRTVAHELGHGAYHLEHPFEEYAGSDEGLSENLMNYGSGTRLRKYQWDYMDDPVFVLPWSGDDEEGASLGLFHFVEEWQEGGTFNVWNNSPCSDTYKTSRGKFIKFNNLQGAQYSFDESGRNLTSVKVNDTIYSLKYGIEYVDQAQTYFRETNIPYFVDIEAFDNLPRGETKVNEHGEEESVKTCPLELILGRNIIECTDSITFIQEGNTCETENCDEVLNSICQDVERSAEYTQEELNKAISALNNSIQGRNQIESTPNRPKGAYYHLLASNINGSKVELKDNEKEYIEENFFLLKAKTGFDFYVLFHQTSNLYSPIQVADFGREIFDASGLNSETSKLIVINYSSFSMGFSLKTCSSIYQSSSPYDVDSDSSEETNDLSSLIIDIFKNIPKPVYVSKAILLADNSIAEINYSNDEFVIGAPYIQLLALYKSGDYENVKNKRQSKPQRDDYEDRREFYDSLRQWRSEYEALLKQAAINESNALQDFTSDYWVKADKEKVKLRHSFIDDRDKVLGYTRFHFIEELSSFIGDVTLLSGAYPISADELYGDIDWWKVIDDAVYGTLDIASFIPVIGDVAELVGFFYAGVIDNNQVMATGYFAGLIIGSSGIYNSTDNLSRYLLIAEYKDDGFEYIIKRADEAIDSELSSIRLGLFANSKAEAQNIANEILTINHHIVRADEIYQSAGHSIRQVVEGDIVRARELVDELAFFAPKIASDPDHLISRDLLEVIHDLSDGTARRNLIKSLDELADTGILPQLLLDLQNNAFRNGVKGLNFDWVRAWAKLINTGLETKIPWLTRVNHWLGEGLNLVKEGNKVHVKSGDRIVGTVRNESLLVTDHPKNRGIYDFEGTPTGEIINSCQLYTVGSTKFFKRVPDKSPYDADELAQLQARSDAHSLDKHGPTVTDEALKLRAELGIAPNGEYGNIVNGTKFNSAEDVRIALFELGPESAAFQDALAQIPSGQSGFAIEHTFAESMGYGFRKNSLSRVDNIDTVVAAYKLDPVTNEYYLITMYPEIQ